MEHSFSNRLLPISLFQGFSRLDFLDIVEQTPFDFKTLKPRELLFHQDDVCYALCMVLGGELMCEAESPDHVYRLAEYLRAPWIVEPTALFGLHNRYAHTYRAHTEVQAVMIDKQSVRKLLVNYEAFQINFYNLVCTQAQQAQLAHWQAPSHNLEQAFYQFLLHRCQRPVGRKELRVKMTDLAEQLDTTRLNVSHMLSRLAERQKLEYSRGCIYIPALEGLGEMGV